MYLRYVDYKLRGNMDLNFTFIKVVFKNFTVAAASNINILYPKLVEVNSHSTNCAGHLSLINSFPTDFFFGQAVILSDNIV